MFVDFCHSTVMLQEKSGSVFSVSSDQAVVDNSKVSPETSLLRAEEAQLPQPLFLCPGLQAFSILVASAGFVPVCDSDLSFQCYICVCVCMYFFFK